MPTIAYDFNDAGDFADFVALEGGKYVFQFKSAEAAKSNAGNPKVVVDLIVTGASEAQSYAIGGLVRQHWPTTGSASGRFKAFMAALGLDPKAKGSVKLEKKYGDEIGASATKRPGKELDADGNPVYFTELSQMMPGEQMRQILGLDDVDDENEEEEAEADEETEDDAEEDENGDEDSEEEAEGDEDSEDDEEEGEEADDEEEEENLTLDEVKKLSLKEMIALAKDNGISVKPPKDKKLTSAILLKRFAKWFETDEEEGEEDPF